MKLSPRSTYPLLLALLCLNLVLRYPRTAHELGYDGFVFEGFTHSLAQLGYAKWIIDPLSYFGLYPLSQPSGSVFCLVSFSLVSGAAPEASILLVDWLLAIVGTLGAFAIARTLIRDELFALLVAAFFSLSPLFVIDLLWVVPTRTMFAALIPTFVWALLRIVEARELRAFAVCTVVLILMASAHRLTVIMAVVIIALVLTIILLVFMQTMRIHFASRLLSPRVRRSANILAFALFLGSSLSLLVAGDVLPNYASGQVQVGSGTIQEAANLIISLTRGVGFMIVLLPVGVVILHWRRGKGFKEPFFLILLVGLIPTLSLRQYTGYYILLFVAVFTGLAVWWIATKPRRRLLVAVAGGTAIAITVASSLYVVGYDLQFGAYLDQGAYTQGLYVQHSTQGTVISNSGALGSKLYAVSGRAYLPVGGATTAFDSPELLIFDLVNRSKIQIAPIPWSQLTIDTQSLFSLKGVQAEADWATLLSDAPGAAPQGIWRTYSPTYLAEDRTLASEFTAYGNVYNSPFIAGVHTQAYLTYSSPDESLWYIGGLQ